MSNWQDGYANTNGIRIHYHRTGGDEPALLLLHGITANGLCWMRVARALESEYDCLLVDARGHGLSDKSEDGYHSDDYAADFAGLIEGMGLGPVLVMGHSLGAISAATLAANCPQLVRGAVLEDPPWRDQSDPRMRMSLEQETAWMTGWRGDIIAQQKLTLEEIIASMRKQYPTWHSHEFPDNAQAKLQVNPNVLKPGILRTWDDLTPKLQCPVLLITGDNAEGAYVTPDLAKKICMLNPSVEHTHIPNTGHGIRRDGFEQYVASVRTFLAAFNK